ncbi:nicotinamide riboside transporter PnuC [Legionella busanensis]|uniref:nicotinamide riboside transporter PnuC n=1 Tax=Legionella busanensis TaxID=190655 RepID=UPI000E1BF4AC|nr:nicotinamide riboside transporter PnuC [Legionella busanensis]
MFLDIFGAITSFLATFYFIRLHSSAWLISLVAISLNSWLYWQKGIYADMVLELFYFITTCYGWFYWRHTNKNSYQSILTLNLNQWLLLLIAISALFLTIYFALIYFTNSDIATLDALTTSLSLVGQWLMCYKFIATWLIWFFTDAIYAYLYWQKQIPFHALLMTLYTFMALYGYYSWLKILQHTRTKHGLKRMKQAMKTVPKSSAMKEKSKVVFSPKV